MRQDRLTLAIISVPGNDDDKGVVACGCGSLFPLKGGSGTIKQGEQASSRGEILHKYKCKYKYCANKLKNQIVVKNVGIIADGLRVFKILYLLCRD